MAAWESLSHILEALAALSYLHSVVVNSLPHAEDVVRFVAGMKRISSLTRLEVHHVFEQDIDLDLPTLGASVSSIPNLQHLVLPILTPPDGDVVDDVCGVLRELSTLSALTYLHVSHQSVSMDASNALVIHQGNVGNFLAEMAWPLVSLGALKVLRLQFQGGVTPSSLDATMLEFTLCYSASLEFRFRMFLDRLLGLDAFSIEGSHGDFTWLLAGHLQRDAGAVRSVTLTPRQRLSPCLYSNVRYLTALTELKLEVAVLSDENYYSLQSAVQHLGRLRKLHLEESWVMGSDRQCSILERVAPMQLEELQVACPGNQSLLSAWRQVSHMVGAPIATACIARSLTSLALQDVHIADVLQVSEVLRHLTGLQKLQWNVTNFAGDGSPRHACTACIPTLQGAEFLAHMPKLNFLELALHLKDDSEFDGVGQLLGALTGLSHLCLVLKSLSESGVMQLRRHLTLSLIHI